MSIYEKPDFYSRKAKDEGFLARSVYKLIEIQEKFQLIKTGNRVLDLGCAPGSWMQYLSGKVGDNGLVIGVDYKDIKFNTNNIKVIKGDFLKQEIRDQLKNYSPYDGILSDMAPDTKGDRLADCYASSELVQNALNFCYEYLKKDGYFIAKIFQGGDEKKIMKDIKYSFNEAKWFKPKTCRKNSIEIYLIGINFIKKPELDNKDFYPDFDNNSGEMPW